MDEYLSEKEQIERIRAWWKENGAWIIVGVGVGILGLAGWNWWQSHKLTQAQEASAVYASLSSAAGSGQIDEARSELERLAGDYGGTPYLQQGRLALAAALVEAERSDEAADLLAQVMNEADDPELSLVARLRLARLLASTGQADRALEVATVANPGTFGSALNEVRGDVLAARGDTDAAREAYQAALDGVAEGGVVDEAFVRMKLEALGGAAAESSTS
ncbi:MAG: tetratricopeptide repeat protein [Gammaproteobacteria bacterium]